MSDEQKDKGLGRKIVSSIRILKVDEIGFDESYQRAVNPRHQKIVQNFDEDALGVPTVALRADGTLWGVDGRQRITALKAMGRKDVRCLVFASEGPEHEAKVFDEINRGRTGLRPLEIYHAMLTAGDEEAMAVLEIASEYGFTIPQSARGRNSSKYTPETMAKQLMCINTVLAIYRRGGPEGLRFTLNVMRDAWGNDPKKTVDSLVMGIYLFWSGFDGEPELKRLLDRLTTTSPEKILYTASQLIGSKASGVAEVLTRQYNRRFATGR